MVLASDGLAFGLIVDEIADTADIVVKPLGRLLKSLQVYSGATILGDGSVALILDVQGLSKVARLSQTESWKKYVADNQFEDAYQNAAELSKFYDEFSNQMRGVLTEAGVKLVR